MSRFCSLQVVLLVALVLVTPFIPPIMASAASGSINKDKNNITEGHGGCVGLHCLVVADDDVELFTEDPLQGYYSSRMLATNYMQITPSTLNGGNQVPDCTPNNLYGASSCLNSNQINHNRPCVPSNREYPYCTS